METKKCPFCHAEIKIDAIKCRFCGEMLNEESDVIKEKTLELPSRKISWWWLFAIGPILKIAVAINKSSGVYDTISLFVSIIEIYFIYLLSKYIKNYINEFPYVKVLMWFSLVLTILSAIGSIIPESAINENSYSLYIMFLILYFLCGVVYVVNLFIVSNALKKIKDDVAGGLKTLGTFMMIYAIWWIISFIVMLPVFLGLTIAESSDSNIDSFDHFFTVLNVVFGLINIYLINKTLLNAERYCSGKRI